MSSERGFLLSYKNSVKEFHISRHTQQHIVCALLKKAFRLPSDVKTLKHPRGYYIHLWDMFNFNINQPFEIIIEEQTSQDKSRSQTYSHRALTKRSGRKYPAQEKQLNDAKFYIDDFQFFMQEISTKRPDIFIGILFFNNKKTARYLSKKILRELIFEFDQVQFFYGLHPLKRHLNTSLLGQTLVFSLFKGKKMIHEREFPQNLSAIQEISGYLKCLIKTGEIPESGEPTENNEEDELFKTQERRNLIQTSQQRSFDVRAENDLRLDDFDHIPKIIEKSKTVDKAQSHITEKTPPIMKFDSPIKSQLGNEINQISFENDLYQPEWFYEGDKLNRIEKSIISALVMIGDRDFSAFCHSLDLKNKQKENLNVGLLRVYMQNYLTSKFPKFTQEQFSLMELNMENRQSIVFSLLLKLKKFGNINDFVENMNEKIKVLKKKKCSYVDLARQLEKRKNSSVIRLKGCGEKDEEDESRCAVKLVGKDSDFEDRNIKIADYFYRASSLMTVNIKNLKLPPEFNEEEKTLITEHILQKDPFLVENYIPSKWSKKKFSVLNVKIVRKYLKQNERRYKLFREFPFEERIKIKLKKMEHFANLLYYLYKQRTISVKQKQAFMYLYFWSDLNVLAAYEFYQFDRSLEELIQNLYAIDFTYYLEGRYGIEMSELENLSISTKQQLIILYLLNDLIGSVNSKVALEKFVRAGDSSLLNAMEQSKSQGELVEKISQMAIQTNKKLEEIHNREQSQQEKRKQKIEDMKKFIEQIKPVHFKHFTQDDLVNQCIELDEPKIHGIFQVYYETNEVVEWIQSFKMYIERLPQIHMEMTLRRLAQKYAIDLEKVNQCRTELIKGVYQVYLIFRDEEDAVESLEKIIGKKSSYASS